MTSRLMAVVLVIGCQAASALDDPAPKQPPPPIELQLSDRFHMYRNLDLDRAMERLLVRGDLADARALAASMARAPESLGLEAWGRHTALVRERAAAVANATAIDTACRQAAQLAAACAGCHVAAGAAAMFDAPPPLPPDRPSIPDRMARHTWAADRMWEGMIGHADAAWRGGLAVLAQTPLAFSAVTPGRKLLAKQLQQLAEQGQQRMTSDTLAERAQLYGEILVTCAACHKADTPPRNDLAHAPD